MCYDAGKNRGWVSVGISKNWRAKPLTSLAVILSLIGATTTENGLKVKARLDEKTYKTGIKITDEQIEKWNIECKETI